MIGCFFLSLFLFFAKNTTSKKAIKCLPTFWPKQIEWGFGPPIFGNNKNRLSHVFLSCLLFFSLSHKAEIQDMSDKNTLHCLNPAVAWVVCLSWVGGKERDGVGEGGNNTCLGSRFRLQHPQHLRSDLPNLSFVSENPWILVSFFFCHPPITTKNVHHMTYIT